MRILISTIYRSEPVIIAATRCGAQTIILLTDESPDDKMRQSLKHIKSSLGSAVQIQEVATDVYDIVKVASKVVELIDNQPPGSELYVDVTTGRKTKSFGLMFGANLRSNRIQRISYVIEETKTLVTLPKTPYTVADGQSRVLQYFITRQVTSVMNMATELNIPRGTIYRYLKELKDLNMIDETQDGFSITDYGRLVLL